MPRDWVGGTASTFKTLGASNHCDHEREADDYYARNLALRNCCASWRHSVTMWEPACGEGHIAEVLKAHGYEVRASDLVDRGYGEVGDFMLTDAAWDGDIITNPPYKIAQQFVQHALDCVSEGRKVAMFLKLTFLEGKGRREFFKQHPPRKVWVSSSRLKCAMNGDFDSVGGSATAYAWFVWEKGYKGKPEIEWFN